MRRARLAVALDVPDADAALSAADRLAGHADLVKVGLELFTAEGPDLVRELVDRGWGVFLDLKLHDIPATVAGAVRVLRGLGVELLTLHASGGPRMIEAAVEARGDSSLPHLLGVTVLTSLEAADLERLGWSAGPEAAVARLCATAREAGCDGVVASVHEVPRIRSEWGPDLLVVTPGIRPAGASVDDQAMVATPATAVQAGADILVVGRPILRAEDPAAAADAIRTEMASVENF